MSYTQFGYSTYASTSPIVIGSSTAQNSCYERNSPDAHLYPRIPSYAAPPYQPDSNLDPSFYTPTLNSTYGMKEGSDPWRSISQSASYYYDPTLAAYGYGGLDFNGARRKNVTRDSTSTLKAWLNEHRKNPYPTKGEKIMLAIITKMTLTQVSTWFANARRRLKKENKMTWEPRNKAEAQDEDPKKEQKEEDEEDEKPPCIPIRNNSDVSPDDTFRSSMSDRQQQLHYEDSHASVDALHASLEASSSSFTPSSQGSSPDIGPMEAYMASHHRSSKDSTTVSSCFTGDHLYKPKIWSLADTATNKVLEMPYASDLSSNGWSPTKTPYQSCGAAIPFQRFGGCNLHGFNPITLQTDTPPQTPPNMKMVSGHQVVPSSASYMDGGAAYLNPPPALCPQDTDGHMRDEKMESFAGNHPPVLPGNASSNQNQSSECIPEDYEEPPRYSVR